MNTPWTSRTCCFLLICLGFANLHCQPASEEVKPPNVILIITDDQGYGDVGAHGNTMIQTPNLDKLWSESVRLTNFHVDPTCSPTRAALMTGRYSTRTGVWHTIMGRSLMAPGEQTIAEIFQTNGYHTGMVGKWHLGDNYPLRPQDQGFQEVVWHKGGGVGQGPDYWGNDYFDDTYWRGDIPEAFEGYCTDIWFNEAAAFIENNQDKPFFLYLSTNAPHGPFLVDEKYSAPYTDQGVPAPMDAFYGMITNIDDNLGRLRAQLEALDLAENTLLIYMVDNGTAAGVSRDEAATWQGYNAGMRGTKASEYDGGHRVPFYVYWPAKGLDDGRDVDQLAAHIDVLPTLVEALDLQKPRAAPIDGTSLLQAIEGDTEVLRDRTVLVHSQRIEYPEKWRKSSVMTDRWRLVNQHELYDIKADPGQENDVAAANEAVVAELQAAYEAWWTDLSPVFDDYVRITIGSRVENPVALMSHDWHSNNEAVPWHQRHVTAGLASNGFWALDVEQAGTYQIGLYRWPKAEDSAMEATQARITVGEQEATMALSPEDAGAVFEVELPAGPTQLQSWLTSAAGDTYGAFFVEITRL